MRSFTLTSTIMQTVKINLNIATSSQYGRMKTQTVAESMLAVLL